jgi:hypothetical protein
MQMRTGRSLVAVAAAALAIPFSANATFYSNSAAFDADNAGLTLITFEGLTSGTTAYNAAMTPGATITAGAPLIVDSSVCGAASDHFGNNQYGGGASISFSPSVNAVGFNIALDGGNCGTGVVNGTATVSLFSGLTLLDTQTFTTASLTSFSTFAGWSGLGSISDLRIVVNSSADFLNLDNLRYGTAANVPEPGTLALLGLGLAGIGALRRRRT